MLVLEVLVATAVGLLFGIGYIGIVCYCVFKSTEIYEK